MLSRVAPFLVAAALAPASAFRIPVASPFRSCAARRAARALSLSSAATDDSSDATIVEECETAEVAAEEGPSLSEKGPSESEKGPAAKIRHAARSQRGQRGDASYDNVADFVWSRFEDSPSPILGAAKALHGTRLGDEVAAAAAAAGQPAPETRASSKKEWSIALHGGAGVMVVPGSPQVRPPPQDNRRALGIGLQ